MLLACLDAAAQGAVPPLSKITITDLAEKVHPQDSTAAAAFLQRRGKTWFELSGNTWFMLTEVYVRVKIYNKEGYSYANPEITFYSGDKLAKGYFGEANTYNLKGGILEKTSFDKATEHEKVIRENVTQKKITLPNVREGSIIEYKYTITTPYFADFRDFYFQFDIPANDVRYDVWIPSYFYYNIYLKGSKNIKEAPTSTAHNKKTDVSEQYRSFTAINVPAVKDEAYVDNIDNYRSTILHELAAVAMPNQPVKYYTSDWKAVAKTIYANEHFGWELRLSSYFENDIDPLLVKGMSDNDKLTVIFDFVKNSMNWNEELGYLCDAGVKKAYLEKTGNVAEINLMLTAMLRHAKLDANPVLVSTRANGVASYPTRSAYNYVIAAVKLNDKTVLLDATAKYTQPDIIPIRAINWEGRLIKRNGDTEQIDLTPAIVSKESVTVVCTMNPDGSITGKARDQYSDYNAYLFRDKYAGMQQDSYLEKLESKYKGISVNDYKVANDKDVTKPIVEDYNFTHDMVTDVIGQKLYLSPMLFFKQNENPFRQETRLYPVDFVFPNYDKYAITIKIPDGYAISSLPKSAAISMAENMGSFKYNVQATDNNIQLLATFEIKDAKISSENYKTLKDFYQKMIEKQNEQIVLTKQ
jgi:hypothetical protein